MRSGHTLRRLPIGLLPVVFLAPFAPAVARAARPPFDIPLSQVSLGVERTGCFGSCPAYRLTISGGGEVVYEGLHDVSIKGKRRTRIPADRVVELINQFLRARFESSLDTYDPVHFVRRQGDALQFLGQGVSDLPTTTLTLKLGEYSKTTRLYFEYPEELGALADSLDAKSGALKWIR